MKISVYFNFCFQIFFAAIQYGQMSEEYIKFFSLDMTNITFNTKKLIQYKNSSYENWKKHNLYFKIR